MRLPDTPSEPGLPAVDRSVADTSLADGGLLVYDPDEPTAWLRTDTPATPEEHR